MRRLFALVIIVALVGVILPAGPAAAQDEQTCWSKGGQWDAEAGTCTVRAMIEVTMDYPMEFAAFDFATTAIDAFFQTRQQEFLVPLSEYGFSPSPGPLVLDTIYEITPFSETVRSILFTTYEFTGGAHGMTTFKSFVFDMANEHVLTLNDLSPSVDLRHVIAPMAREQLSTTLGEMSDEKWLQDGTAPTPENYAHWILTPDALVFTFPAYQVAAYAAGPQQVTIPLSAIHDVLAPEFRPAG